MTTYTAHPPDRRDPEAWWVTVTDLPGWEAHVIDVLPDRADDGRYRLLGLRINPRTDDETPDDPLPVEQREPARQARTISATRIRTLPIGALAEDAYAARAAKWRAEQRGEEPWVPDRETRIAEIRRRAEERRQQQPKRRRGRPPKVDLQEFAEVYTVGLETPGVNPRQEVAELLGLAPRTIDRYVTEARRTGLIPGTDKKGATHEQD